MPKDISTPDARIKVIQDYLVTKGWTIDKWGHARKTYDRGNGLRAYRYKFQTNVIRFEVSSECGWVRIQSLNMRAVALNVVRGKGASENDTRPVG